MPDKIEEGTEVTQQNNISMLDIFQSRWSHSAFGRNLIVYDKQMNSSNEGKKTSMIKYDCKKFFVKSFPYNAC